MGRFVLGMGGIIKTIYAKSYPSNWYLSVAVLPIVHKSLVSQILPFLSLAPFNQS